MTRVITHGTTTGYQYGCRCRSCLDAKLAYNRDLARGIHRARPEPRGRTCGLIGTYNRGCRCDDCREAGRVAKANQRAKKRAS